MLRDGSPSEIGAYLVRFTDGNFGLAARTPKDDGLVGWSDIVDEAGLIRPADSIVADGGVSRPASRLGRGRHARALDGLFFGLPASGAAFTRI